MAVKCDHFMVEAVQQCRISQGYRKSVSEVYTYEWRRRIARQRSGHFRMYIAITFLHQ